MGNQSLPFLHISTENDPINLATDLHLSGKRRTGNEVVNPYKNIRNAFHITFYERLTESNPGDLIKLSRDRGLKIGYLYNKPGKDTGNGSYGNDDDLAFRESSFTVYSIP